MLIGIDATRANKTAKTGVEWYAWHVIQELKKQTLGDGNSWILYANAILTGGLEALPDNWYEVRAKWPFKYGWTQFRLAYEMYKRPADVLWMPGATLPRYLPKRTVVTEHDIGFHRLPKLYKPQQVRVHEHAMKEVAKRAQRIITVSEFSGREIAEVYGIDPRKIAITPLGVDHNLYRPIDDRKRIEDRLRRYQLPRPYFLYVGRLEAKKNIAFLIRAFTEFKNRRGVGDPHRLALIGLPGFGYDAIKRAIADSTFRSDILELGYVPETDMPFLLSGAEALVHPSLYEGFGLTTVQAMAAGCPVLSSNAASLPEIIGGGGEFFSPNELEQCVELMNRLVSEPGMKTRLREKGIERAKKYTWEQTAQLTAPVLTRWE